MISLNAILLHHLEQSSRWYRDEAGRRADRVTLTPTSPRRPSLLFDGHNQTLKVF